MSGRMIVALGVLGVPALALAVTVPTVGGDVLLSEGLAALASGNWLLALQAGFWLVFFVLQGKAWVTVPWVSEAVAKLPGKWKALLVLGLAVALGAVDAMASGAGVVGLTAGVMAGVKLGVGAMGVQGLIKALRGKD